MRSILRLPCWDITPRMWAPMPSPRVATPLASSLYCARHRRKNLPPASCPPTPVSIGRPPCGAPPHGNSARVLRPLPPVPADRATYTTAADGRLPPATVPQCCRTVSIVRPHIVETPSETCPRASWPLASLLVQVCQCWLSQSRVQSRILDRVGVGEKVRGSRVEESVRLNRQCS